MQKKYSRTEWKICGAVIAAALAVFAYQMYTLDTPEYKRQQTIRLTAELDKESAAQRLAEQRDDLAKVIHQAMLDSLRQCATQRDADALKSGATIAIAQHARCVQEHKRKFDLK